MKCKLVENTIFDAKEVEQIDKPRLIDAKNAQNLICGIDSEFAKFVDEIPTAYDIDKVVEQLLKKAYKVTEKNTNLEHAVISFMDVIKIVKGGGTDE